MILEQKISHKKTAQSDPNHFEQFYSKFCFIKNYSSEVILPVAQLTKDFAL